METIIAPTIYVKYGIRYSIWPLMPRLSVISPTEKTPVIKNEDQDKNDSRTFLSIKKICPLPLGEDIQHFEGIIRSYLLWAEHIGLGNAVQAQEFRDRGVEDPESVSALIQELKGKGEEDSILQSRIILELSFILDEKEDLLAQELRDLSIKEQRLLASVSGTQDGDQKKDLSQLIHAPMGLPKKRLRAWTKLIEKWGPQEAIFFILESSEIKEVIEIAHEKLTGHGLERPAIALPLAPLEDIQQEELERLRGLWVEVIMALQEGKGVYEGSGPIHELKKTWLNVQPIHQSPMVLEVYHLGDKDLSDLISTACGIRPQWKMGNIIGFIT